MYVEATYSYYRQQEKYNSWSLFMQIVLGPPIPPVYIVSDSSTGLGQIYAKTAITAMNWYNKKDNVANYTEYDPNNWHDLETIWTKLNSDNAFNIEMVAMILAYNKATYGSDLKTMLARYNGFGDAAEGYADVTYEYYLAFKQYNQSVGW